jgi:hypothetical protein
LELVVTTTAAPAWVAPEVLVAAGQVPRELLVRRGQQVLRAQQAVERVEPEVPQARVALLVQQARPVQRARPVRPVPQVALMLVAHPTPDQTRLTHPELHQVR